jgi:hypothetical protein
MSQGMNGRTTEWKHGKGDTTDSEWWIIRTNLYTGSRTGMITEVTSMNPGVDIDLRIAVTLPAWLIVSEVGYAARVVRRRARLAS